MDYRRPQNNRIEHKTINRKSILLILSPFKRVTELDVAKGSSIFLFTISFRVTLLYVTTNCCYSKGIFPVES